MEAQGDSLLFDVETPLGFHVHCYQSYWIRKVVAQHPIMEERLDDVKQTLSHPHEIRLSSSDDGVYLFYATDEKRFVCAVARQMDGEGFLITAYPTDRMKQGKTIWTS